VYLSIQLERSINHIHSNIHISIHIKEITIHHQNLQATFASCIAIAEETAFDSWKDACIN
jgi:hypothetical protein